MDVKDLKEAISAASNAFYKWKNTTPKVCCKKAMLGYSY
jgi:acyl-CoA reductase-like NAD-dependent aldehyde dehydrogenase